MVKYSLVIPTYNRCDTLLRPCLDSIIKYTNLHNVEIIVVANGCVDNTKEYINSLPVDIKLVWIEQACGYPIATNAGMHIATGEYVILLNNDVELTEQLENTWLTMLEAPFINNPKVGITGNKVDYNVSLDQDCVFFYCAMIHRNVIDAIGYLDEQYTPGGVEDHDYCLRTKYAGFELDSVDGTKMFPLSHKDNQTMKNSNFDYIKVLDQNKDKFFAKFNIAKPTILAITMQPLQIQDFSNHIMDHDSTTLPFGDASVTEILLLHVLHRYDFFAGQQLLKECNRILKPKGKLYIESLDLLAICTQIVTPSDTEHPQLYHLMYGQPWINGQGHKFNYTEQQLTAQLTWAQFRFVQRWDTVCSHASDFPINCCMTINAWK